MGHEYVAVSVTVPVAGLDGPTVMFPSPQSHLNVRLSVDSGSDEVAVNAWVTFVNVLRYVVPEMTGFTGGWFGVIVPVYCRTKKSGFAAQNAYIGRFRDTFQSPQLLHR